MFTIFGVNNTAAWIVWEVSTHRFPWLNERWALRLLALASGTAATTLVVQTILDWHEASGAIVLIYPLWCSRCIGYTGVLFRISSCLRVGVCHSSWPPQDCCHDYCWRGRGEASTTVHRHGRDQDVYRRNVLVEACPCREFES